MHLNKYGRTELDQGDIIELKEGKVYATIPYHLLNKPGEFGRGVFDKFTHTAVDLGKCEWLQGKYVVYKTTTEPGPVESHDEHPQPGELGWHVFCERLPEEENSERTVRAGVRVDFVQSSGWTAVQYAIEVIGQAELTYKEKT